MQRSGSPWRGMWTVMAKETADHLTGARMRILEILAFLAAAGAVYAAVTSIRTTVAEDPFLFLRLFTTDRDPLPAFVAFLGFITPLVAIALGFDLINGEFNRRTMSRVLAQPIYRDGLLLGKYLSGLATLSIILTAIWLLVAGLGLLFLAGGGSLSMLMYVLWRFLGRAMWIVMIGIVFVVLLVLGFRALVKRIRRRKAAPMEQDIVAQSDAPPRGGAYPTSWWMKGEVVSETVNLSLTGVPEGVYWLAAGLYDRTLTRLPAVAPDGYRIASDRPILTRGVRIKR